MMLVSTIMWYKIDVQNYWALCLVTWLSVTHNVLKSVTTSGLAKSSRPVAMSSVHNTGPVTKFVCTSPLASKKYHDNLKMYVIELLSYCLISVSIIKNSTFLEECTTGIRQYNDISRVWTLYFKESEVYYYIRYINWQNWINEGTRMNSIMYWHTLSTELFYDGIEFDEGTRMVLTRRGFPHCIVYF